MPLAVASHELPACAAQAPCQATGCPQRFWKLTLVSTTMAMTAAGGNTERGTGSEGTGSAPTNDLSASNQKLPLTAPPALGLTPEHQAEGEDDEHTPPDHALLVAKGGLHELTDRRGLAVEALFRGGGGRAESHVCTSAGTCIWACTAHLDMQACHGRAPSAVVLSINGHATSLPASGCPDQSAASQPGRTGSCKTGGSGGRCLQMSERARHAACQRPAGSLAAPWAAGLQAIGLALTRWLARCGSSTSSPRA